MNEFLILRLMGVLFVLFGIMIRLGYWRRMYFASRGGIYAYAPMGLLFILYTYYEEVTASHGDYLPIYYVVFGILILLILYISLVKPRLVKPKWVLWVEKYPEKIRQAMAEELKTNREWQKNTLDEAAVDEWAKRLSKK